MTKKWTHTECFAFFGTVPRNIQWSWSGRSPDGSTVSVTLWQDLLKGGRIYDATTHSLDDRWTKSNGFNELIENLKWAKENLGGIVRVIIAIAKDKEASPRSIRECFPHESLRMRVVLLDETAGHFRLERVD